MTHRRPRSVLPSFAQLSATLVLFASLSALGQAPPAPPSAAPSAPPVPTSAASPGAASELRPFGSNLFQGNFLKQATEAGNPDYIVAPGDRVAVNTWGAVQISEVFTVDGQGNVFLPGIGPVKLSGVRNAELTAVVQARIGRVYLRNFEVYTNLLTAAPVAVYVTGNVLRPGRYSGIPSDPLLYFLDQAGGIDPRLGSYRKISVLRAGQVIAEIDLYAFLREGKLPAVQLQDGDTVLVAPRGPVVELRGTVAAPALIEMTGAQLAGADALAIVPHAARATALTVEGIRAGERFARTISVEEFRGTLLENGDVVTFRDDGRPGTILVRFEGEIDGPSVVSVRRGARLLDVLNYVRVDPTVASTRAVHIRRASVAAAQKKSIDDSLFRLERSSLLGLSQSTGEAEIRVKEAELMTQFVERARQIQPLGRVVTSRNGRQLNVMLEDGDVIVIPSRTNVVRISGEVTMSQAVPFEPGLEAEEYIERAGGYTERADEDRVIVLHASADVTVGDTDVVIQPGDEILVAPEVDAKVLQNTADVVQIIYQIAVAAAVVIAL
jgi:protein involved in polysaccharide export with SLBB domain